MDVKLDDEIVKEPRSGEGKGPAHVGRVVYVHPEGRYYTLEFTYDNRHGPESFRESFLLPRESADGPKWTTKRYGAVYPIEHVPPGRYAEYL